MLDSSVTPNERRRCAWAVEPAMVAYHGREWGVPVHDDRHHFELLTLEGAQAGLSWRTVLLRRDGYRRASHNFDPAGVAALTEADVDALVANPEIIRHRGKIESTLANARAFLEVQREHGSFDAYIWGFVPGLPMLNRWTNISEIPATTSLSAALSKDLRSRGFRFVGPTICYSHLQAAGLVMDHVTSCFRFEELATGSLQSVPSHS